MLIMQCTNNPIQPHKNKKDTQPDQLTHTFGNTIPETQYFENQPDEYDTHQMMSISDNMSSFYTQHGLSESINHNASLASHDQIALAVDTSEGDTYNSLNLSISQSTNADEVCNSNLVLQILFDDKLYDD